MKSKIVVCGLTIAIACSFTCACLGQDQPAPAIASATAAAPTPAASPSPAAAPAPPTPAETTPAVQLDATNLNPAFNVPAAVYWKALDKGTEFATKGRSMSDVLGSVSKEPYGAKGEKGTSHQSIVVCYSLDAAQITLDAYNATNNYEPVPPPPASGTKGTFFNRLDFYVSLAAWPKSRA